MLKFYKQASQDPHQPDPIVLAIPDLSSALPSLVAAMVEALPDRLDVESKFAHLGARPLLAEVANAGLLSERALWALLVEQASAPTEISAYVNQCIEACDGELRFCTEVDVLGQEAPYAYIDRYFRRQAGHVKQVSDDTYRVIEAFERFLAATDMDHETHQNDYLNVVIRYLWSDPDRRGDFVVFRILNGQYDGVSAPVDEVLRAKGQLRLVVDKLLELQGIEWRLHRLILELCAVVYGSDEQSTKDVIDYCRARSEFDEKALSDWMVRNLEQQRSQSDLWLLSYGRDRSSGFHTYSRSTGRWSREKENDA